jgi:CRISPR-associated exonuclease Cas4
VLGEIKKSSSGLDASILQLTYYLYRLEQEEVKAKGEVLIPKERKKIPVVLDDEAREKLAQATEEITALLREPKPPAAKWLKYCPNCAYAEFCWSGGNDED